MKKKVYISGKITGIEEEAIGLFKQAEIELMELGFDVVNPMNILHDHDQSWHSYMKEDVKALCDCDAIYMLPNWRDSKGAIIENTIANWLGMKVLFKEDLYYARMEKVKNFEDESLMKPYR